VAVNVPALDAEHEVGLVTALEHETPPVQLQLKNCHPVEGVGRFAVAEKLPGQVVDICPFVKVPPHAVIDPGVTAPKNVVGAVLKVTVYVGLAESCQTLRP
jgi:hypothetical protein